MVGININISKMKIIKLIRGIKNVFILETKLKEQEIEESTYHKTRNR